MASYSFDVDVALQGWTDSGIVLLPGQSIRLWAGGTYDDGAIEFSIDNDWFAYPEGAYAFLSGQPPESLIPKVQFYDPSLCYAVEFPTTLCSNVRIYSLCLAIYPDGDGAPPTFQYDEGIQGDRYLEYTSESGGRLWACFNDTFGDFEDNTGTFHITVEVPDEGIPSRTLPARDTACSGASAARDSVCSGVVASRDSSC